MQFGALQRDLISVTKGGHPYRTCYYAKGVPEGKEPKEMGPKGVTTVKCKMQKGMSFRCSKSYYGTLYKTRKRSEISPITVFFPADETATSDYGCEETKKPEGHHTKPIGCGRFDWGILCLCNQDLCNGAGPSASTSAATVTTTMMAAIWISSQREMNGCCSRF